MNDLIEKMCSRDSVVQLNYGINITFGHASENDYGRRRSCKEIDYCRESSPGRQTFLIFSWAKYTTLSSVVVQ